MQARARFVLRAGNPLRRSCVSRARNVGESAICPWRAQPSAEIVRVECAKSRRERDLSCTRATLRGDRACRAREMQARVRFVLHAGNLLRRSCMSSARKAGESAICPARRQPSAEIVRVAKCGESAICPARGQPSAEIVRVECAKCRRERNLSCTRATLCGDHRACRVREMQTRARFDLDAGNPLRRSCVSSARNAGESTMCPARGQPSAEMVRVECAKCRRQGEESHARAYLASCKMSTGEELEDENWRLYSKTLVRGVSEELEDENW